MVPSRLFSCTGGIESIGPSMPPSSRSALGYIATVCFASFSASRVHADLHDLHIVETHGDRCTVGADDLLSLSP